MKNELLTIGPITIYGYGLMIALGILAAYLLAERRAAKYSIKPDSIFSLTIWCAGLGLVGAKLLYIITQLDKYIANPKLLLNIADGFVVYGGIIGGIIAGIVYCRIKKQNFLDTFDLVVPSIALAQGIGRIGCFLAGCCYGCETDSAFSITFHNSQYAPNDVALVPTQLISSGLNLIHFAVLMFIASKTKKRGVVGCCYLIFYSIGRFILEFYRGDLIRGSVGKLSTSQFISIFLVVIGVVALILCIKFCDNRPEPQLNAEDKK